MAKPPPECPDRTTLRIVGAAGSPRGVVAAMSSSPTFSSAAFA